MKKLLVLFAVLVLGPLRPAAAESYAYANLGPLSLPVPWDNMNVVYLYNETERISQVGGEMVFAELKAGSYKNNPVELQMTAGGVLNPSGNNVGTAFAGLNLWLPNPIPQFVALSAIQPGLFGGYDINQHKWVFGLKAAINVFKN